MAKCAPKTAKNDRLRLKWLKNVQLESEYPRIARHRRRRLAASTAVAAAAAGAAGGGLCLRNWSATLPRWGQGHRWAGPGVLAFLVNASAPRFGSTAAFFRNAQRWQHTSPPIKQLHMLGGNYLPAQGTQMFQKSAVDRGGGQSTTRCVLNKGKGNPATSSADRLQSTPPCPSWYSPMPACILEHKFSPPQPCPAHLTPV